MISALLLQLGWKSRQRNADANVEHSVQWTTLVLMKKNAGKKFDPWGRRDRRHNMPRWQICRSISAGKKRSRSRNQQQVIKLYKNKNHRFNVYPYSVFAGSRTHNAMTMNRSTMNSEKCCSHPNRAIVQIFSFAFRRCTCTRSRGSRQPSEGCIAWNRDQLIPDPIQFEWRSIGVSWSAAKWKTQLTHWDTRTSARALARFTYANALAKLSPFHELILLISWHGRTKNRSILSTEASARTKTKSKNPSLL